MNSYLLNYLTQDQIDMIWGTIIFVFGVLYSIKSYVCFTKGSLTFWDGIPKMSGLIVNMIIFPFRFPFFVISLLFIHWKPKAKTLFKEKTGILVTLLGGSFYAILALGFIVCGLDKLNLQGSKYLNLALNGFNEQESFRNQFVVYNQLAGYRFPMNDKIGQALDKSFNKKKF